MLRFSKHWNRRVCFAGRRGRGQLHSKVRLLVGSMGQPPPSDAPPSRFGQAAASTEGVNGRRRRSARFGTADSLTSQSVFLKIQMDGPMVWSLNSRLGPVCRYVGSRALVTAKTSSWYSCQRPSTAILRSFRGRMRDCCQR